MVMRTHSFANSLILFLPLLWGVYFASSDVLQPVYNSPNPITNVRWSEDGQTLTFQATALVPDTSNVAQSTTDAGRNPRTPKTWHLYRVGEVLENNLETRDTWEQVSDFGLSQSAITDLASNPEGQPGFTFLSPDTRFLVYPAQPYDEQNFGWPLVLKDLTNDQVAQTGILVHNLTNFFWFYRVIWSADSTAFIVQLETGFADSRTHYVSNFASGIDELTQVQLDSLTINGETLALRRNFASLSRDGTRIILPATYTSADGILDHRLVVVDIANEADSLIIARGERYSGASFSIDEAAVFYVGETGLARYDLFTGETDVLNAEVTSRRFQHALFSPDMQSLALIEAGNFENAVFVLPLVR